MGGLKPAASLRATKCTIGCPLLDKFLRGGLPCGLLIELAGPILVRGMPMTRSLLLLRARRASAPHFCNQLMVLKSLPPGEATAAKTQTCLQALLCTQLPSDQGGLHGSSL